MGALMLVVVISASYLPDYKIIPAYEMQISIDTIHNFYCSQWLTKPYVNSNVLVLF